MLSLAIEFFLITSTALSLLFISARFMCGSNSHLLKSLEPIGVNVLSNIESKVLLLDVSLIFFIISKFLIVEESNIIEFVSITTLRLDIWGIDENCVSSI